MPVLPKTNKQKPYECDSRRNIVSSWTNITPGSSENREEDKTRSKRFIAYNLLQKGLCLPKESSKDPFYYRRVLLVHEKTQTDFHSLFVHAF
jgi:hypothetical protein